MELELRTFATFREAVGEKTTFREYDGEEVSVGEVLRDLEESYEGLAGQLIEDGDLRPQINVLKNGREVLHMDGLETMLADGDSLSIFPPVAGGAAADAQHVEKSFRGISVRLARRYLENLGGTALDDETVEGDGWTASLSAEKVSVGPSLQLTEVTVVFEATAGFDLDTLIEDFSQKAMRAGG
jgi:molybdopterin synthase sulfur carrier subunit